MKLLHYSDNIVEAVYSRAQSGKPSWHRKPSGFWVTVEGEDGWSEWCKENNFHEDSLAVCHEVILCDSHNVLYIHDALGIDDFTEKYGFPDYGLHGSRAIDWSRVADDYQGIVIVPYIWSRRLGGGADWYYGWDCASGCIWDASAIQSISVVSVPALVEAEAKRPAASGLVSIAA